MQQTASSKQQEQGLIQQAAKLIKTPIYLADSQ
jgi:hypothetical protein